ncbi:MAG: hypothetical protein ACI4JS_07975 [Oscillospiraceae bacterium]
MITAIPKVMTMALSMTPGTTTPAEYEVIKFELNTMIDGINALFGKIPEVLSNPNYLKNVLESSTAEPIISAIKAASLTLCVLFFLIDFFSKTLNLQWVKWENVMMLCIKLVFAKILIDKSPELCEAIYSGLSSIVKSVVDSINKSSGSFKFIADGNYEALWLSENEANKVRNPPTTIKFLDFSPILIRLKSSVMSFIMTFLLSMSYVIAIGRIFELVIYTIIAPLPLSTFSTDGLHEIGKGFLKSYVAVSIQALVMVVMIVAYTLIINEIPKITIFDGLLKILAFSIGMFQSGAWAKRICNAM